MERVLRDRDRRPRRHHVALQDGRSASALEWPGDGVPVVLLHGLLDSGLGWQDLCQGTSRHCIAVDLGGSDLPARPSLKAYAEDVAAVLAALVAGPFDLVGHSLGGGVATAAAEHMGNRVAALVLLAPAGFGRIHMAEAVSLPLVRHVTERTLPAVLANRRAIAGAYRAFVTGARPPPRASCSTGSTPTRARSRRPRARRPGRSSAPA